MISSKLEHSKLNAAEVQPVNVGEALSAPDIDRLTDCKAYSSSCGSSVAGKRGSMDDSSSSSGLLSNVASHVRICGIRVIQPNGRMGWVSSIQKPLPSVEMGAVASSSSIIKYSNNNVKKYPHSSDFFHARSLLYIIVDQILDDDDKDNLGEEWSRENKLVDLYIDINSSLLTVLERYRTSRHPLSNDEMGCLKVDIEIQIANAIRRVANESSLHSTLARYIVAQFSRSHLNRGPTSGLDEITKTKAIAEYAAEQFIAKFQRLELMKDAVVQPDTELKVCLSCNLILCAETRMKNALDRLESETRHLPAEHPDKKLKLTLLDKAKESVFETIVKLLKAPARKLYRLGLTEMIQKLENADNNVLTSSIKKAFELDYSDRKKVDLRIFQSTLDLIQPNNLLIDIDYEKIRSILLKPFHNAIEFSIFWDSTALLEELRKDYIVFTFEVRTKILSGLRAVIVNLDSKHRHYALELLLELRVVAFESEMRERIQTMLEELSAMKITPSLESIRNITQKYIDRIQTNLTRILQFAEWSIEEVSNASTWVEKLVENNRIAADALVQYQNAITANACVSATIPTSASAAITDTTTIYNNSVAPPAKGSLPLTTEELHTLIHFDQIIEMLFKMYNAFIKYGPRPEYDTWLPSLFDKFKNCPDGSPIKICIDRVLNKTIDQLESEAEIAVENLIEEFGNMESLESNRLFWSMESNRLFWIPCLLEIEIKSLRVFDRKAYVELDRFEKGIKKMADSDPQKKSYQTRWCALYKKAITENCHTAKWIESSPDGESEAWKNGKKLFFRLFEDGEEGILKTVVVLRNAKVMAHI